MKFNIRAFYDKRGIDYITKGVNVKKDEINISCPFCNSEGNPDPSYHLGVDPKTGYWSCWRSRKHRGKRLQRLLMKVANISYQEACRVLGEFDDWFQEGSFDILAANPQAIFSDGFMEEKEEKELQLLEEFKPLNIKFPSARLYVNYLLSRGFHKTHLKELIEEYNIYFCRTGKWSNRIILPVDLDFQLQTWTGRDIRKNAFLRYRSLSEEEGATISIKDTVFNFDNLIQTRGKALFVTEGPFDAIKIDFYAKDLNCRATCLFSKALRESQAILLSELAMNYKYVVFLLDAGETDTSMIMSSAVAFLGSKVKNEEVPPQYKDPGEMNPSAIYKMIKRYK